MKSATKKGKKRHLFDNLIIKGRSVKEWRRLGGEKLDHLVQKTENGVGDDVPKKEWKVVDDM